MLVVALDPVLLEERHCPARGESSTFELWSEKGWNNQYWRGRAVILGKHGNITFLSESLICWAMGCLVRGALCHGNRAIIVVIGGETSLVVDPGSFVIGCTALHP
jgi:hypothetical protein